ncbi:hypothetical protein [Paenibacillus amylolyticus]|uniref:hypothetical protein n=1 Tax=Paenibacillus amylolyticus TaxID=1451 RepID=UPI003D97E556
MFILSFGVKDESMVLEGAVVLISLSQQPAVSTERVPPPYFNETGFIGVQKKDLTSLLIAMISIRNTVSPLPLCSETGFYHVNVIAFLNYIIALFKLSTVNWAQTFFVKTTQKSASSACFASKIRAFFSSFELVLKLERIISV